MKCPKFLAKARHLIVIEQFTPTTDDYGGETIAWSTVATVWSIIEPMSGSEVSRSEQLQSRVTHRFTIRFLQSFSDTMTTAKHRISYDSRFFDIKYVRNIQELDKFMEMFAEEGSGT